MNGDMSNNDINNLSDFPPFFGHDEQQPAPTTGPMLVPNMYSNIGLNMMGNGNRSMEQLVAPAMALRPDSSTGYQRRPASQGNTAFLGFGRTSPTPSLQRLAIPPTTPQQQHQQHQQTFQTGFQQGNYPIGQQAQPAGFAVHGNTNYGQNTNAMSPYDSSYVSTPVSAQSAFSAQEATNFRFDRVNLPVNNGSFSAGGFFGANNANAFGNFGGSNLAVGPVFDPSTGQTSHNPIQSFPSPASATLMSQNLSQASHTSHLSVNSAPPSATVAFQGHSLPSTSSHTRPLQLAGNTPTGMYPQTNSLQPSLLPTSPSPYPQSQDNRDVLYGVGVQNMPSTLASSQPSPMTQGLTYPDSFPSQSSPEGDVVLREAEFSQTTFNALLEVNNQHAVSLPVLRSLQSQTGTEAQQSQEDYSSTVRPYSRPRLLSAVTATSDNSFGLDSSSPLSSISVAADNGSSLKFRSAPPSTAGDVAMRNKVAGVPGSMQYQFNVGDNSHNVNTDEHGNAKRRHSDDVEATAALSKKMAKGKKSDGMSCVPCAIKRKKCDNGSPCDNCQRNSLVYPVCIRQGFPDHNIFLDGLRSDLKERATAILDKGEIMSMNYNSGLSFPLELLSEYKFGNGDVYRPLLMGDPLQDKSFYKPFYQASILLQAREFLTAASKSGHRQGLDFTPELEDNLRLMQALSAVRALGFIKAMLNKNRMDEETPKFSRHSFNLLIGLCMFFEQTLAFEKTHPKESLPMSETLAAQHRELSYHLAYLVRFMADRTYGDQSALSKLVEINAESVNLNEGFWDRLRALHTDPSQLGGQAGQAGQNPDITGHAMDHASGPTISIEFGEASKSLTTPDEITGTSSAAPTSPDAPYIFLTRPTGLQTPTNQAPASARKPTAPKSKLHKAAQKLNGMMRKGRKRKDDDQWIDSRDKPDADIIFTVRAPLHHDNFDNLLHLMEDVHISDNGEGNSSGTRHAHDRHPHHTQHAHDDGTVFFTSPVGDDMQWHPSEPGSPSNIFDGLDLSNGSINNSVSFDDGAGDNNNVDMEGFFGMDGDNALAESLSIAQDVDNADPRFVYSTANSVELHPDLAADNNTAPPRTPGPMPGPVTTGTIIVPIPAPAPSVSSGPPSESGSTSCRPSSARSSLMLARTQSTRALGKMKKMLGRKGQ